MTLFVMHILILYSCIRNFVLKRSIKL